MSQVVNGDDQQAMWQAHELMPSITLSREHGAPVFDFCPTSTDGLDAISAGKLYEERRKRPVVEAAADYAEFLRRVNAR